MNYGRLNQPAEIKSKCGKFKGFVVVHTIILIWMVSLAYGHAIGWNDGLGGRAAGMGNCSLTSSDLWSVYNNQAGAAWIRGWQAGLFSENRFIMETLNRQSVAAAWGGKPGTFGLTTSYYGFSLYHEWFSGFTYARKFGKRFSAGIQFYYLQIGMGRGYRTQHIFSGNIGLMARPDDRWTIAFQVQNPIPVKLSEQPEEILPIRFRLGISFNIPSKVLVAVEGGKGLQDPFQFQTGIEVQIVRFLHGRLGATTGPFSVTGGFGFHWGKWVIDLATAYHIELGFSPAISLGWQSGK